MYEVEGEDDDSDCLDSEPRHPRPPPIEYDAFLERVGMSFLPTRRNTSFAGLGPIPEPPADLKASLMLLCITAPEVSSAKRIGPRSEYIPSLLARLARSKRTHARRAVMWMLRAVMWMLRAVMWMLRAVM
eukprot:1194731-Prorocentrum_minimum.AAC.3